MNVPLKLRSAAIATILAMALLVIAPAAPAPQDLKSNGESQSVRPSRIFQAPVNLKVLPKNLTGQQVHDIMEQWGGELGVRCSACHAEEQDNVVPGGPTGPRFADDSKPMKGVARLMYAMTEEINANFVAKVDGSGLRVTCGTCHRCHISPEPSVFSPVVEPSPNQVPLPQVKRLSQ